MTCLGRGLYGPVGRTYKAEYYTWLHTKYLGFGPFGFGEDFYGFIFPSVSLWELLAPRVGPFLPRGYDSQDLFKAPNNKASYQI